MLPALPRSPITVESNIDALLALTKAKAAENRDSLTKLCSSILNREQSDRESPPLTLSERTSTLTDIPRLLKKLTENDPTTLEKIRAIFVKISATQYTHSEDLSTLYAEVTFINENIVTHIEKIPVVAPLLTNYLKACKATALIAIRELEAPAAAPTAVFLRSSSEFEGAEYTTEEEISDSSPISPSAGYEATDIQHIELQATAPAPFTTQEHAPLPRLFGAGPTGSAFSSPLAHQSPSPPDASQQPKSSSPLQRRSIQVITPTEVSIEAKSLFSPLLAPTEPPKLTRTLSPNVIRTVQSMTSFDKMYASIYSLEKMDGLCSIIRNTLRVATWIVTFITPLFLVMGIWWACSKSTCFSK